MPAIDRELNRARRIHQALQRHTGELSPVLAARLTKLTEALATCEEAEDALLGAEVHLIAARMARQKANAACSEIALWTVDAARADTKHGRNSPLVSAMGYKTDQTKAKSGPKRKRKPRAKD